MLSSNSRSDLEDSPRCKGNPASPTSPELPEPDSTVHVGHMEQAPVEYHSDPQIRAFANAWVAYEVQDLKRQLGEMGACKDAAYLERSQLVAALSKLLPSGVARTAIEGWSEDWHGCVYIDLSAGKQLSWHFHDSHTHLFKHLPPYTGKWDGHTTEEKYLRLADLDMQWV